MKSKENLSINDHFLHSIINPTTFWDDEKVIFKDRKRKVFEKAEIALLSNSSSNLKYCIENAWYYLNISHPKNIKKISRINPDSFKDPENYEDHIRAIGHKFLIPSIIIYNASFDYIRIFFFFILFKRTEIIKFKDIKKEQVIVIIGSADFSVFFLISHRSRSS